MLAQERECDPDRIRLTLDLRVLPEWEEERAVEELRALLAARVPPGHGVRVEVLPGRVVHRAWTGREDEHINFTTGFFLPDRHPMVEAAAGAIHAATGHTPAIRQWKFGTDGGHSCGTHGIPPSALRPGKRARRTPAVSAWSWPRPAGPLTPAPPSSAPCSRRWRGHGGFPRGRAPASPFRSVRPPPRGGESHPSPSKERGRCTRLPW